MVSHHLVRYGALASVGRFVSRNRIGFPRGARVVCETERGLEVGDVLAATCDGESFGQLVRTLTAADLAILARVERLRRQAYDDCCSRIGELGLSTVLMDVEQLLDEQTLYFYVLGDPRLVESAIAEELASRYAARVEFHAYGEPPEGGCGDCGCGSKSTDGEASGGGGCSTCSLIDVCRKKVKCGD